MRIQSLSFRHHKNAPPFFENLSFSLEPNKLHALHGKNGVGKTVLLHILSGRIDSQALIKGKIDIQNAVLVNQRFDQMIADRFTFAENLQFACLNHFPSPFLPLKQARHFQELTEHFHIGLDTPAYKLSGGQRQILALLMVLQREAKLLLLDEPTAALDAQNAEMVFEFLSMLDGTTLLVVCHDKELVSRYTTGSHFTLEMAPSGSRILKAENFLILS